MAVRNTILDQWCRELINNGKADKFLSNNMGMLLSFVFLFYQNVREDLFEKFINLYGTFLEQNFCIGDERIPIENIWLKGILFYSDEKYFEEELDVEKTLFEEKGNYEISLETVKHFPHRLVHPERIISTGNGSLRYVFRFNTAKYNNHMITMDDYSRAVDYTLSMMAEDVGKKKFPGMGLQKRAFKPDGKYKHLIVSKHPSTFRRGENFSNYLDECIRDYILSPFEEDTAKGFSRIINKAEDYESKEDVESIKNWSKMVVNSRRFTQCVEYVISNCVFREERMSESEFRDLIQKEYEEFVNQFCSIMIKYKHQMLHLQRAYLKGIKGEYF